jgi:hypothetical protein
MRPLYYPPPPSSGSIKSGATGSFSFISSTTGITGPTGSFQDLIVANQITAPGGITGPTGSFSNLITSQISSSSNNITTSNRIYQQLGPDPSLKSVKGYYGLAKNNIPLQSYKNGYYGLAKDAYPALNPYSSGVKAVSTWTTRSPVLDNSWNSVCWAGELGLFVAVSSSGTSNKFVMTSPDGINWTIKNTPSNNTYKSVVWAPELSLFVTVADDGGAMISSNGIDWTVIGVPEYNWTSVCWSPELRLFVAVSRNIVDGTNSIMYSYTGSSNDWFLTSSPTAHAFYCVCWAAELGLFVAVGKGTENVSGAMTSPDGINWTTRVTNGNDWRSVCWSGELGLLVAVSIDGTDNRVMTSPDGITWTVRTSAVNNQWNSVCWSGELGLFVAVSSSGSGNRVMTSPDGITWTLRTTNNNEWNSICWAPELGIFAAVSSSGTGNRVMTSSLSARPPTSYNVFDSPFNRIDENGNWFFNFNALYANDTWLTTNLINNLYGQPPSIVFNEPLSTSTSIYISWTYPQQYKIGTNNLLPQLDTFSLYVNSNISTNYVVDASAGSFIKNLPTVPVPVTMIILYKNAIPNNKSVTDESYNVNSQTYTGKAYNFYDATISTRIINNTITNKLYSWYQNDSTFNGVNVSTLDFLKFIASGPPSEPLNLIVYNPTSTTLDVSYNAPQNADTSNPGQGSIISYTVKYSSVGSSIRFPNGIAFSESTKLVNTTPLTTTKLTGLYPDSSFNVQVRATNNSNLTGDYTGISNGITTSLNPSSALTSITFTYGQYNNINTTNIFYITNSSTTNSITKNLLASDSLSVTNLTMPIHRRSNRGKLQGSGTIMTFTTNLNENNSLSINYQGFSGTAPNVSSNLVITMTPTNIVDNYSGSAGSSGSPGPNNSYLGFYLNARMNMSIKNTGFIAGTAANEVNFSQLFANGESSSGKFSFYYDEPISTAPTVSLSSFGIALNTTNFKKISGINVLYTTTEITIIATATNMGKYFYSSPPLSYTCQLNNSSGTGVGTFSETSLANVSRGTYYPSNFLVSPIVFNSRFSTSNLLQSSYATQLYLSVIANNVYSASSSVGITQSVIVDGPSNTLVYSTFPTLSIPTATSSALAGYRVWSATTVNNNCPDLSYNGTIYNTIQYDNSWNITTINNGYDATTELLVSNGRFRTPGIAPDGLNYYRNYNSYLYNSGIDYSQISASGFRFATFCWKIVQKSGGGVYFNLSFTINSISPTPTNPAPGLLLIGGRQIQLLYFFQDQSQPSTFSSTVFNSVWIDGNKNTESVDSSNFFNTNNPYGYYGGFTSSSINDNNATINVFIPGINTVSNSTYLYLRLAIPMDISISFGNVTATIS